VRKNPYIFIIIGIVALALGLYAVVPRQWEVRSKEDFLKGKLNGISVSYNGFLSLSPNEDKVEGPAEDFYLSLVFAQDGTMYLGTGHGGKIYRIAKDGKADLYFQAPEMDITCLVLDEKGTLFAGTSPNGKIYKITGKDQSDVFFNPGEKYIWDLTFVENGFLLAAVGEGGGIYKISPQGEGQQILKAEENHILCLKKDGRGGIIAGSGGVGVVYKLGADGRASVLFESPFEEIRSIALDEEGRIYAAASGTPSRIKKEEASLPEVRISTEVTVSAATAAPPAKAPTTVSAMPSTAASKEPGALYRIRPDGLAKKLWESGDELIYSLLWQEDEKRCVFGTGNKGRIYIVDKDENASLLVEESSEQVYALIPSGPKIYMLGNNPSHLASLLPEQRSDGEYVSEVLDAGTLSSWGRLEFVADLAAGTTLQIQTRSGNSFEPNTTWSEWSPPIQKKEEQILSPKGRYLQFKALFKTQSGTASPKLRRVAMFYLQANIAPVIQKLELLPPNEVYLKPPEADEAIMGAEELISAKDDKKKEDRIVFAAKKVERKGYQTVTWEAADENGDRLLYAVSIRKDGEAAWRLVKEGWKESPFVFDTLSFPDGIYIIKLEASDMPSNPPGMEQRAEKISQPFVVDNSLPVIKNLTVVRDRSDLEVTFAAEDSFSALESAEYLVRPGEWRVAFPADGICDSKAENFKFRVPLPAGAENMITVRVTDRHHNVGVERQSF
jgi:hypothetical protein